MMLYNRRDTVVKARGKVTDPGATEVCKSSQVLKLVKIFLYYLLYHQEVITFTLVHVYKHPFQVLIISVMYIMWHLFNSNLLLRK
jgi:hypothetical protein